MEFLTDGNFKREIKISLSKHRFTTSEIGKLSVLHTYIPPVSVSIYYVNIYFFWSHLKIWLRLNCREDSALLWPRNKVKWLWPHWKVRKCHNFGRFWSSLCVQNNNTFLLSSIKELHVLRGGVGFYYEITLVLTTLFTSVIARWKMSSTDVDTQVK